MATLTAPTRTAREAAQAPTIGNGTAAVAPSGVTGPPDGENLDEDVDPDASLTSAANAPITLAVAPATMASGDATSAAEPAFSTETPPAPPSLKAHTRPPGPGISATAEPQDLTEQVEGQVVADPQRPIEAQPAETRRVPTLEPASAGPKKAATAQPAPGSKAPQEPSPPVADLPAEVPTPATDLPAQSDRADAAPNLAAAAQVAGPQSRDGLASARPDRTERSKAADEARSGKDAAPTASAVRPSRSGGSMPEGLAEAPPLPAASPEESAARDDSAAPDVLGSPDLTADTHDALTTGTLTPTVRGSPETVATLAAQIVKKLEGRSTRFDLELDPAGLGRVDVRIEIGARGHISAAMSFETPQAASELRARSGELRQALEQAGFDLSGGLSFDVAGDRGQARQDHQGAQQQAFRGQAFQAALETAGDAADAAIHGGLRLRRGLTSSLDLRI